LRFPWGAVAHDETVHLRNHNP